MDENRVKIECGPVTLVYVIKETSVEWTMLPTASAEKFTAIKRQKFDSLIQVKVVGDDYPKGFVTGHSMRNSQTVKKLRFIDQIISEQNGKRIETHLTDTSHHLYKHIAIWRAGTQVIETYCEVQNLAQNPLTLEMLSSFSLSMLSPFATRNKLGQLELTRYHSKWSFEGRRECRPIEEFQLEPSWKPSGVGSLKFGQVGSMPVRDFFPYVAVTDVSHHVTWAVTFDAPGSWQMEGYRLDEDLALSGGLADRDFGQWVKTLDSGETFATPHAFLTVVAGDETKASQVLQELARLEWQQTVKKTEKDLPIVFNEFCTTWGNPSEASIKTTAHFLKDQGINYYVIDAGWYADEQHGWEKSHGDWQVNATQFPNGLSQALHIIRDNGLIPGIWFEIETVGRNATAFHETAHLLKRDCIPLTVGDRRFWDMRDPWVQEYLQKRVIDFLKHYQIGYLKIDYNENFGLGFDDPAGFGESSRQQLVATQAFIKKIKSSLPNLVIENCSSGGHRLEPSFMRLADLVSASDAHEANIIPVLAKNLQSLVLPQKNLIWVVVRQTDSIRRLYYSFAAGLLGRLCLSGDYAVLTDKQSQVVKAGLHFYRQVVEIIKNGESQVTATPLLSYRELRGHQIVRRTFATQQLIVIHSFENRNTVTLELPKTGRIVSQLGLRQSGLIVQQTANRLSLYFEFAEMSCALLIESA